MEWPVGIRYILKQFISYDIVKLSFNGDRRGVNMLSQI